MHTFSVGLLAKAHCEGKHKNACMQPVLTTFFKFYIQYNDTLLILNKEVRSDPCVTRFKQRLLNLPRIHSTRAV